MTCTGRTNLWLWPPLNIRSVLFLRSADGWVNTARLGLGGSTFEYSMKRGLSPNGGETPLPRSVGLSHEGAELNGQRLRQDYAQVVCALFGCANLAWLRFGVTRRPEPDHPMGGQRRCCSGNQKEPDNQMRVERPRVAAIGLENTQIESIKSLCETPRTAGSVGDYTAQYNWTETDIVIASGHGVSVGSNVHVLAIEPRHWQTGVGSRYGLIRTLRSNTEWEIHVPPSCPELYKALADDLALRFSRSEEPPSVFHCSGVAHEGANYLVQTTSGYPVALQFTLPGEPEQEIGEYTRFLVLALPRVDNLTEWLRAFLSDINKVDKVRVPHPPPRLSTPWDWYTPREKELAQQIAEIKTSIERMEDDRNTLEAELKSATHDAEIGTRKVLWVSGPELVSDVNEILTLFGFNVEDMDAQSGPKDAKREDLRLTLDDRPEWEALVEVKGYTKGAKTSDARQIRDHQEKYVAEKKQLPDLTLWIANPFRRRDPSNRPSPDNQAIEASEYTGVAYVLVPDLYRLRVLVEEGTVAASEAARRLVEANPGLWGDGT